METSVKRSAEEEFVIVPKRSKTEYEARVILDFSDCVLLKILSFLESYDLFSLSKTCCRFKYLIQDRKLWKKVDLLDHPMCSRKFSFFFKNIHNNTDTILVSGISKKEKAFTFCQFIKMNKICEDLTVLAIENQYINSDEIILKQFPETLKELSLRGTHIYGRQPFLQDAHTKLTKLHTLILANCKWFHEHSLMALSKLKSLENLSLYKCANLNDSVAYMSVTAKFGFRKLRRIDARRTSIGDQFLKCFHCVKTLREIYLEAPERRRGQRRPRLRTGPVQRQLLDELQRLCSDQGNEPREGEDRPPHPWMANFEGYRDRYLRANLRHSFREAFREIGVQHVFGANGANAMVFSSMPWRRGFNQRSKNKKKLPRGQIQRDSSSNCLHQCRDCSLNTCSVMPIPCDNRQKNDFKPQLPTCSVCNNPTERRTWQQGNRNDHSSPGTSKQNTEETKTPDNPEEDPGLLNLEFSPSSASSSTIFACSSSEDLLFSSRSSSSSLKNFADFQEDGAARNNEDNLEISVEEDELNQVNNPIASSSQPRSPSSEPETPEEWNPPETLYCDDVSDTEDEDDVLFEQATASAALLELELMQADVTDAGVQWFMGARPDAEDPPGETSVLFRPPFHQESTSDDESFNQPGPSGYKVLPQNDPTLLPPPSPTRRSNVTLNQDHTSSSDSDEAPPAKEEPPAQPKPQPEKKPPPAEPQNPRVHPNPFNLPPTSRIHGHVIIQNPRRRGGRRRDLRVIIERLDPGVHIVYDGGEAQDYTTRLKVLVCRGYRHITDTALRSLMDLHLEYLDVRGTSVTAVGVVNFLMLNPDCELLHDTRIVNTPYQRLHNI